MSRAEFRKIDVDALDPDNILTAQDLIPPQPPVSVADVQATAQQVRSALQKGDHSSALQLALQSPPYGGDDAAKDVHLSTVLEILLAVKSSEITNLVNALDSDSQTTLVKYLYKGMGSPAGQANGGVLLSWFDKVTAVTGDRSVIQYMSDRRTV